jgi:DNA-binding CsgD family transcriptional regulator
VAGYSSLPDDVRTAAERVLTRKQLDVFRLWCSNYGTARMAMMLDVSESTVRVHLRRAQQKLKIEMERVREAA